MLLSFLFLMKRIMPSLSLGSKLRSSNPSTFTDFSKFIASSSFRDTDIIVESASQDAVNRFSKKIVEQGKSLIVMSVGALADPLLLSELLDIASHSSSRIYVPTGAIAGIDAIRSVRQLLDSVVLTTTKNPRALADAPFFNMTRIDVNAITEKTIIYEGSAADAVKQFPTNVNVAANTKFSWNWNRENKGQNHRRPLYKYEPT